MSTGRRVEGLHLVAALAVVLLLASFGVGCSSGSREKVVVYSGRSTELIKPVLDLFAKETGISVEFKQADTADLALTIEQEGDRSPADVFISQTPGATSYLASKGLLRTLPNSILERVEPENRSANGEWVGLSARIRVLVYNTELVDPATLPRSVFDLTDPQYRGKLGVAPTNGSFQDFVSAMRVEHGDDVTRSWLEGIEANQPRTYANNNAIVDAVGRGEVPMGLANHYYLLRAKKEDPGIPAENYFFPDRDVGSVRIVSAAAVLKSAKNPSAAERLVQFLLSEQTQRYFADETLEYPLVQGVEPAPGVPPIGSIPVNRVDFDELGARFNETVALIKESGLTR
ncbi:MAG: iron ABC transporter substrate-binding protein [Acidimicrobiales bacterium]|nr:iron ABC transporter substrate-binding protein [Acidimicrobiales bacterium]